VNGNGSWAAVLFDLDGTLADTVQLILHCYRHTMRTHLGRELPDERWLATIGTPLRDQLRDFARDEDEAARMLETYVTYQRGIHDRWVSAFPGAADVVGTLKSQGIAVGVVTSKRREMALRTLDRCGLEGRYDVLVAFDDVERGKPDPQPVLRALSSLGIQDQADRTLMVGDSPWDIRAGRRAGTRTAAALWGPYDRADLEGERPDYWLEELRGVLALTQ
jgi:pyrophosphatase PpaX